VCKRRREGRKEGAVNPNKNTAFFYDCKMQCSLFCERVPGTFNNNFPKLEMKDEIQVKPEKGE
jgi:hypothetical protein